MKLNISPQQNTNTFDISRVHCTTSQFGHINIADSIETLPGDRFNIDFHQFARTAPLALPTFGKIKMHNLATYVPYHLVDYMADAYISGDKYFQGNEVKPLFILQSELKDLFIDARGNNALCTTDSTSGPIFMYVSESQSYYFTPLGKFVYKLLRQLGYDVCDKVDTQLNVYPLLAFCKAYNDLLSNQNQYQSTLISNILGGIYRRDTHTLYSLPSYGESVSLIENNKINIYVIGEMLMSTRVLYNDDMYTSAWKTPNNPLGNDTYTTPFYLPITSDSEVRSPWEDRPDQTNYIARNQLSTHLETDNSDGNVTQISLNYLRKFDKLVRTMNYVGSKTTDRLLARYGINVGDVKHLYAQKVNYFVEDMLIGDITSQSGTSEQPLGSYAGKSVGSADGQFSFQSDDYGQLFIMSWFSPEILYRNGLDKSVLRTNWCEFYQPELDGEIADPISAKEITSYRKIYSNQNGLNEGKAFGFTERYTNNYRTRKSVVTGDMTLFSDMYNWVLGRNIIGNNLEIGTAERSRLAQDNGFMYQPLVNHPMNTIFETTNTNVDHFYNYYSIKVRASRHMLSNTKSTGLEEGNTTLSKGGMYI